MNNKVVPIMYNYESVPTLYNASQSKKAIICIMGPYGSGKSTACCWRIMEEASKRPIGKNGKATMKVLVLRNTEPALTSTTMRTWNHWFPEELFGEVKWDTPITHHFVWCDT